MRANRVAEIIGRMAWAAVLAATAAQAQTTWDGGGGNSDWFTAANWSNETVPNIVEVRINAFCSAANPVVVSGPTTARPGGFHLGFATGNAGYLVVTNGVLQQGNGGSHMYVGNGGYGELHLRAGGSLSGDRDLYIGWGSTAQGEITIAEGASAAIAREVSVGGSGVGALRVAGTMTLRSLQVGNAASGDGTVVLDGSTALLTLASNAQTILGMSGKGVLVSWGGSTGGSSNRSDVRVRDTAGAFGLYRGWGVNTSTRQIINNGLVIADGEGVERDLDLTALNGYAYDGITGWGNTIDNTDTNGWYAVNKGRLLLYPRTIAVGTVVTQNWAEAEADADIDLVNSLRFTFASVTTQGALTVSLLATDRAAVPAPPSGKALIGVWDCTFAGAFTTLDLEARYDHVAAGGAAVSLLRYNPGTSTWDDLGATVLSGYRLSATGVTSSGASKVGLIAVACNLPFSGTLVLLR